MEIRKILHYTKGKAVFFISKKKNLWYLYLQYSLKSRSIVGYKVYFFIQINVVWIPIFTEFSGDQISRKQIFLVQILYFQINKSAGPLPYRETLFMLLQLHFSTIHNFWITNEFESSMSYCFKLKKAWPFLTDLFTNRSNFIKKMSLLV